MRRNKHIIPEQNGEDENVADHAQDGENRQRNPVDAELRLGGIGEMRVVHPVLLIIELDFQTQCITQFKLISYITKTYSM